MKQAVANQLRLETDYFRKSNNQSVSRQRRIRSVQLKGIHVLSILLVIAVVLFLAQRGAAFLLTWDKLKVRSFQVENTPVQSRPEMQKILNRFRGNILAIDLNELKRSLLSLKEVREVSLTRMLPDTLKLSFELRQPLFQIEEGRKWNIFDECGVELFEADHREEGLIPVIGTHMEYLGEVFARASEMKPIAGEIDYVAYRMPYGLEVKLKGVNEILYPGEGDLQEKFSLYFRIRSNLEDLESVIYADLRLQGRLYLGYRDGLEENHEK